MDFPYVKEALTKLVSKPSTNPYPFAPAPATAATSNWSPC